MTERSYLSICFSCPYGPPKASVFGYCQRQKSELKGPILALNMLHCLVTKCKLAGIPASLPEPDLCNQTRFLFPVACNNCIIGLSKPLLVVELPIFKQADNSW